MKIYFASYQSLYINRGGPTYKIEQLFLELKKTGIDIELFDMWNAPNKLTNKDLFHLFTASWGTYHLATNIRLNGGRYIVNPIIFSQHCPTKIKAYHYFQKKLEYFLPGLRSDYSCTQEICQNAELIIPNTKAEGDLLIRAFGISPAKSQVIYNGVEKCFAEADSSLFYQKYGLKDFILYVGHLGSTRKNGKRIVQALQKIDAPSVIIADVLNNSDGKWCEEEINKTPKIKLIKWLEHDNPLLASAYAACDVFALPTLYETPGRAALEAGLAGAKIGITPFGGTKEYFSDFADYINPYSVSEITSVLEKVLNKPKSQALKKHILEHFIWEKIAWQTKELYQRKFE
jgi:glycosyltransferase involved in cell wall biosynthesis